MKLNINSIKNNNDFFDEYCSEEDVSINNISVNESFLKLDSYNNYDLFTRDKIDYSNYKYDEYNNTNDFVNNGEQYDEYNNSLKIVQLLKDFEEKNKQNEWPISTNIACYWCCHTFTNPPFGIPIKYCDNKFHVYGCFCSLECAAAYNFDNKSNIEEMWERFSLINLLSRMIDYKNVIRPAPTKLCLTLFGGQMNIDEYRSFTDSDKIMNVNFPPMMTIVQQLEEINGSDLNNDFKYIPLDIERIKKYKDELRLKRIKPVNNYKNTLDHAMNLKIN
jgi:hypothetical protein